MVKLIKKIAENNNKHFIIKDRENFIQIKQPNIRELDSLYYMLLKNLTRCNKIKNINMN
ncbi:MAG: hypothetical protein ACR2HS_00205 [Gammaproteobacteria bacterium]